jgi:CubicO group peptidase (beta-lactamase class C family)
MTSFLVGLAQEQGLLDINDASSDYMGQGWTSLTAEQEAAITVRNQLTMTTGLSDLTGDADCTDPECLVYLADPGDRWAYHNAPYTLLDSVLQSATGTSLNLFLLNNLSTTAGIFGGYFPSGYNNVLFSKPRVFARFGLLMLNQGNWNGTQIMNDMNYFNAMTHSSQDLNPAYGYLWWLNGSSNYMLPGSQISFPGPLAPDAPSDMYSAMGKNGQIINIVPSQNLIMVRIGEAPTNEIFFVPNVYNNTLWQYLNNVMNCANRVSETNTTSDVRIYPNPTTSYLQLNKYSPETTVSIFDCIGNLMMKTRASAQLDVSSLSPGSYQLVVTDRTQVRCHHFIKD